MSDSQQDSQAGHRGAGDDGRGRPPPSPPPPRAALTPYSSAHGPQGSDPTTSLSNLLAEGATTTSDPPSDAEGTPEGTSDDGSDSPDVPPPRPPCPIRDRGLMEHGCSHYRRRCRLLAPCCLQWVWCRFCHDDAADEGGHAAPRADGAPWSPPDPHPPLDRKRVTRLRCALCALEQPVARRCGGAVTGGRFFEGGGASAGSSPPLGSPHPLPHTDEGDPAEGCGVAFGAYGCLKCNLFDDNTTKRQFHCDDCGICRVGGRSAFWHCGPCGACFGLRGRDDHRCVADATRRACPICLEELFEYVGRLAVLPCGHVMHHACHRDMLRRRLFKCPWCSKSTVSLDWGAVDHAAAETPMPAEYAGRTVLVVCNDCRRRSRAPFHVVGLRCGAGGCGSYNTSRVAEREVVDDVNVASATSGERESEDG